MNLNKDKWKNYHKRFIHSYCVACQGFRAFDARSSKALFYWALLVLKVATEVELKVFFEHGGFMEKLKFCVVIGLLIASLSVVQAMTYDFWVHEEKNPALISAVEQDDVVRVDRLLALDGNTEMCDSWGRTPFLIAVAHGNVEIINLLMQYGVFIAATDVLGNTALHIAVLNEQSSIVPLLLNLGLDVRAKNFQDKTPVRLALEKGGGELLEALIPENQ
jgi:hypothetical protein